MDKVDVSKVIPVTAIKAVEILTQAGFQGFYVGGCVRDILLGVTPKDYDITTNARPDQTTQAFESRGFTVHPTGIKHGTVTVVIDGENIEITTFRTDGTYSDGRHPDTVTFVETVDEDLSRRDFTINAMAIDNQGNIIDIFGGRYDLQKKIIRAVGNADDRLNEDALRMLRAIRFSCRLGFVIDGTLLRSIERNATLLQVKGIKVERINVELTKIVTSKTPSFGVTVILKSHMLEYLIPEIYAGNQMKIIGMMGQAYRDDAASRLAALFCTVRPSELKDVMRRLTFDNETMHKVVKLNAYLFNRTVHRISIKHIINGVGADLLDALEVLQIADIITTRMTAAEEMLEVRKVKTMFEIAQDILDKGEPLTIKDLAVNGDDLIAIGIKPGKEVGRILNALLTNVLERPFLNTRGPLLILASLM